MLACSRYIEMNPVRAEMVAAPGDYPYSSDAANAHGDADPLVVSQPAYLALATTPAARSAVYRAMFLEALPADTLARRVERDGHGGDRRSVKFRERAHDQDPLNRAWLPPPTGAADQ